MKLPYPKILVIILLLLIPIRLFAEYYDWEVPTFYNVSSLLSQRKFLSAVSPVSVSGSDFIVGGQPKKFWGFNLVFESCFPDDEDEADQTADGIAFLGANLVRFHHMDYNNISNNGIFDNDGTTLNLNATSLQKLDRMTANLKERGIYWNLNTYVSRHWKTGDGLVNVTDADWGDFKSIAMFNDTMIQLQKDYASALLNHVNEYTGIAYKDDPALAIVEIINEASLINDWRAGYYDVDETYGLTYTAGTTKVEPYRSELTTKWNDWLEDKYGTPEAVISAHGMDNINTTQTEIMNHSTTGALQVISPAVATLNYTGGTATINVTTNSANWYVQYQKNFNQTQGKAYEWNIELSANANRSVSITVQGGSPAYTVYAQKTLNITTSPTNYQFWYSANETVPVTAKTHVGDVVSVVTIGNMTMEESQDYPVEDESALTDFTFHRPYYKYLSAYNQTQQNDITEFIYETQKAYLDQMTDYLKNDVGVTCAVGGIGGGLSHNNYNQTVSDSSDAISVHTYYQHPYWDSPCTTWSSSCFSQGNTSMLNSATLGMVGVISNTTRRPTDDGKPYFVGEWQDVFPDSHYQYSSYGLMASAALNASVDGLTMFQYEDSDISGLTNNVADFFSIAKDPMRQLMFMVGGRIFLRHGIDDITYSVADGVFQIEADDLVGVAGAINGNTYTLGNITIKPQEDGAVYLYSINETPLEQSSQLALISVGSCRNTGGGTWNNATSYNWGTAPTQINAVPVEITLPWSRNYAIRSLTNTGMKDSILPRTIGENTVILDTTGYDAPWYVLDSKQYLYNGTIVNATLQ